MIIQLDLEKIPLELAELTTTTEAFRNTPWLVHKDGVYKHSGDYQRCEVKPELEQWFKDNITNNYLHISACRMFGETHNAPHTDTTRDYTLIYLTDLGGTDVKTRFYQEIGHDIHRPRDYHPDYDNLELLVEYKLDLHTWYLLDSRVVHSVEGIETERKAIQVGFGLEHSWVHNKLGEYIGNL